MKFNNQLRWSAEVIIFPLFFVLLLWIVYWVEIRFSINLNTFGIYPREVSGLVGIFSGPFIHGSLKHLFNNSIPFLVLSTALFYFYREQRWRVLLFGWILTGILTWIIGRPSLHIGASGVVYMLVAFLFFKGILSGQFQLTALALVVVFLYGGLWWYVFPIDPAISWEGHLSGFIVGIAFAFIFKGIPLENKKYEWEKEDFDASKDPFMRQFDAEGNFVGPPKPVQTVEPDTLLESSQSTSDDAVKINYTVNTRPKPNSDKPDS